ncbi:MAG: glycosyltransferase [Candidatus Thorarchaeota archaeon]
MNIAMIHFRIGELDGVSLEMEKWKIVLEKKFGHKVTFLAGSKGQSKGHIIPELSLDHKQSVFIFKNAFSQLMIEDIDSEIKNQVTLVKPKIIEFLDEKNIEFVIPNNIFSLPLNIPASLALYEVFKEKSLPGINHNHDFFWERASYIPTCPLIHKYLLDYFPPDLPLLKQVVINSIAKQSLKDRRGLESTVVPNVFYFEKKNWIKDKFNADLKKTLKIKENDIVILQATRIVERKGIELIIDVISKLNQTRNLSRLREKPLYDGRIFGSKNRIILIMPNLIEDEDYKRKLEQKSKYLGVDYRFCNEFFAHERQEDSENKKRYSLWDSYVHSDIISYPSLLEGWGNQFLEGVKAKLPIVIFEYDVYKKDIKPLGFETISLGSEIQGKDENGLVIIPKKTIENVSQSIIIYLQNKKVRQKTIEKNFKIGLEKLSLTALGDYLRPLLPRS